jgi:hypothetical protein
MQVLFKQILNLEIWHDFFLGQQDLAASLPAGYDLSGTLALVPTEDCLQVLKNLRWVFRPQAKGGVLLAQVEAIASNNNIRYQTRVPITRPERLTFWLQVSDRTFANFTNLPFDNPQPTIFYFSNLSNNIQTADTATPHLFLSQPLSSYATNREYLLGELVVQETNTLEAVQYQPSSATAPAESDWEFLPLSQYVSALDQVPRQGFFYSLRLTDVLPGEIIQITLTDVDKRVTFIQEVNIPDSHSIGDPLIVPLQFSGQKTGFYRLLLDGIELDSFVLCDPLISQNAFALVEITLNPSLPTDFALLQVSDRQTLIQPKTYRIRFKNRVTRWRYHSERPHGFDPTSPIAESFVVLDPQTYATRRPLGLRQQIESPLNNGRRNLPPPNAASVKPVVNGDRHITDVFSDVYL